MGFNPTASPFPNMFGDMSQFKRKRSDTIPGPPAVHEEIALKNPTINYWEQPLAQMVSDLRVDPSQVYFGFIPIIFGFLTQIQTEYTKRISFMEDQLELEVKLHKNTKSSLKHVTFKVKTLTSNRDNLQIEPLLSLMPALIKRQRKGLDPIIRTGLLPPKASGSTPEPPQRFLPLLLHLQWFPHLAPLPYRAPGLR
jgi:hypothetical protein